MGTNRLVACSRQAILEAAASTGTQPREGSPEIPLWDGQAAIRIAEIMLSLG
jgi:hypothetical protein